MANLLSLAAALQANPLLAGVVGILLLILVLRLRQVSAFGFRVQFGRPENWNENVDMDLPRQGPHRQKLSRQGRIRIAPSVEDGRTSLGR